MMSIKLTQRPFWFRALNGMPCLLLGVMIFEVIASIQLLGGSESDLAITSNNMKPANKKFAEWRTPRRGERNPDILTNPYWVWGVQNPQSGFDMDKAFGYNSSDNAEPSWSFKRHGQTKTTLADGTVIQVAGEHEDSYDPDFFIYNDVVVTKPDGEIIIYGYSIKDFPPTDFHSATLVGNEIILIGSLGYPEQRNTA